MNIWGIICLILAVIFSILAAVFALLKEKGALLISGFNTLSKELEPLYTKSISLSTAASIKALKSFVGVIIYESYLNSNNASATS